MVDRVFRRTYLSRRSLSLVSVLRSKGSSDPSARIRLPDPNSITPLTASVVPMASLGRFTRASCSYTRYTAPVPSANSSRTKLGPVALSGDGTTWTGSVSGAVAVAEGISRVEITSGDADPPQATSADATKIAIPGNISGNG